MLAAFLIRSVLVTRIGLAADSHSCRDQREPGSAGARVFQPMRGPGPGIEIPPYTITRGSASASQQQVISLGTPSGLKRYSDQCRWCLNPRPQLQNNTTTKQYQTEGKGLGPPSKAPEPIRAERMRRSDDDPLPPGHRPPPLPPPAEKREKKSKKKVPPNK